MNVLVGVGSQRTFSFLAQGLCSVSELVRVTGLLVWLSRSDVNFHDVNFHDDRRLAANDEWESYAAPVKLHTGVHDDFRQIFPVITQHPIFSLDICGSRGTITWRSTRSNTSMLETVVAEGSVQNPMLCVTVRGASPHRELADAVHQGETHFAPQRSCGHSAYLRHT